MIHHSGYFFISPSGATLTGHGHGSAATTLAQITLGISDQGDSAKATYETINQRSSTITKLLKGNQLERIKTSNIQLNPKYGRDGKPAKATYEGYQNIQFQLPIAQIEVLDKALARDVDSLQTIRYIASEDTILSARDKAIEKAIADAQAQATVALDKLDLSSQEIIDIQIEDAQLNNPDIQAGATDTSYTSSRWSGTLSVEGSEQIVEVQVTLKIGY